VLALELYGAFNLFTLIAFFAYAAIAKDEPLDELERLKVLASLRQPPRTRPHSIRIGDMAAGEG
jgi:hypothetical protein